MARREHMRRAVGKPTVEQRTDKVDDSGNDGDPVQLTEGSTDHVAGKMSRGQNGKSRGREYKSKKDQPADPEDQREQHEQAEETHKERIIAIPRLESAYNPGVRFGCVAAVLLSATIATACDFSYSPATAPRYYRADGWSLPGTKDLDPTETAKIKAASSSIPGTQAFPIPHSHPFIVDFPEQIFTFNSAQHRMHAMEVMVSIIRWQVGRRVVAYSYNLIPVDAHQENGKWKIDAEAACVFFATFIDDKGDGVFRLLVPDRMTSDLIPAWAKREEN